MEISGLIIQNGVSVSGINLPVSGDPSLSLGDLVNWTSNTYFYTTGYNKVSNNLDYQYDTNNMVWQVFYAHVPIKLSAGGNRWGPIPRSSGNNSLDLYHAVSTVSNSKTSFNSNIDVKITNTPSATYFANTLYETSITANLSVPANRYFLLGIVNGPYYKNYRKLANCVTAVNNGTAVVTVLPEVYIGPWPSGPLRGVPTQLSGNTSGYTKISSNIYYSAFKFELA